MAIGSGGEATCTVVGRWADPLVRSLVAMLAKEKRWDVKIADPKVSEVGIAAGEECRIGEDSGAELVEVDLLERSQLLQVIRGSSVVFLMDLAESSTQGFYHCYLSVVQGTKNVINACKECKVKRLVYNSSADVVFDGLYDIQNGNESLSYPCKFEDMLNGLKAQAEAMVLFANGDSGLLTCALRPSSTFGPRDIHLVKSLIDEAKSGRFKFIIGSDKTLADFTYVENVAHAHILAEKALHSEIASVAGESFFITNLEPAKIWEFLFFILEGLGHQRPRVHLPVKLTLFVVMLMEWVYERLGLRIPSCLTPSMIHTLTCTRTFDCSKAQKILHYSPIVSLEEGIMKTVESFSYSSDATSLTRGGDSFRQSKADKFLGGSGVAEILLWRDEKKTFLYLFGFLFLFHWFLISGRALISAAAQLMLLVTVILFVNGNLPSSIYGFSIKKIPSSWFEVSETSVEGVFKSLAAIWNQGVSILQTIAQGDDGKFFLKVAGSVYLLKLVLQVALPTLVGVGLVSMFTVFIVYEQHEAEFDRLMMAAAACVIKSRNMVVRSLPGYLAQYVCES